uniref:Girdin n=1 Tax=Heligmosomoides polygyrus TaxID=6339 RepID=A0A8L8KK49_HELPZ
LKLTEDNSRLEKGIMELQTDVATLNAERACVSNRLAMAEEYAATLENNLVEVLVRRSQLEKLIEKRAEENSRLEKDVRPRRRADWELSDEPDRKIARPAVRDSSPQRSHRAPRSAAFSPDRSPIRGRERAIKYPSAKEPTETWRSSSPPRGGVNDTRERDPWSALEEEMQSIVMKKVTDAVVPKAAEERIPLRGEDRSVSDWRRIRDEPLEPRGKLEDSARGGNFSYSARNGREDSRSSRASVGEGKLVNVWRELDRMKREDREAYDLLLNVVEASKDPTFTLVDAFLESDRSPQRRVRSPDRHEFPKAGVSSVYDHRNYWRQGRYSVEGGFQLQM